MIGIFSSLAYNGCMKPLLSLTDIYFSQNDRLLLKNISLSVSRGHILGLLGVNGAGKSTTLKIAAGILSPDSGYVEQEAPLHMGYLPETPPLIPQWTTHQCLQHFCRLQGLSKNTWRSAIERVIQYCDLAAIIQQRTATLSKGNQQRVAIAQAIIHQPDLLILDEPTSGLDPQQIIQFRELLQTIKTDTAILFSSHIMHEVSMLCDAAVVMHQGKLMGKLDLSQAYQQMVIEFAESIDKSCFSPLPYWQSGSAHQHHFYVNTPQQRHEVLSFCLQQQLSILHISGVDKYLENEFLSLILQEQNHV